MPQVQFIEMNDPRKQLGDMLGMSLGQGLSEGLNTYFANNSLNKVLNDKSLEDADPSVRMSQLQQALAPWGETGQKVFQNRLQIEGQRMQEQEQKALADIAAGKEIKPEQFKKLQPQTQLKALELRQRKNAGRSVYEALIKAEYDPETAALWQHQMENAPTGGQSDVIKNVNDLIRRSKVGKGLGQQEEGKQVSKPNINIPGVDEEGLELDFPDLPEPINLTSADIVKQNSEREKTNVPYYIEATDRLNALDEEYRDIGILQQLNGSEQLPSGAGLWNVDWDTGELRVKWAASPEAQLYVKTIANMAKKAKDFFPGRVSNFELGQFQKTFPTLANSPEGRSLIAKQLSLANRIAYLKDETLKAAYDHYGSNADPIAVRKYANDNYRRLKKGLEEKLNVVNTQASDLSSKTEKIQKPPLEDIFG